MGPTFEWDEVKDVSNQRKHGITFDEAATVFRDTNSITISDDAHSDEEDRYLDIGMSSQGRLIVVCYTERPPNIRIISSRKASKLERNTYEQG
jgi:uncharacterized DUF497 family protein